MAAITSELSNFTELLPPGLIGVRLTTTSTSDTWTCPYFAEIIAAIGNNETDNDGVSVSWSGKVITVKPTTAADVITLIVAGRG
jgi:hypothetical protein